MAREDSYLDKKDMQMFTEKLGRSKATKSESSLDLSALKRKEPTAAALPSIGRIKPAKETIVRTYVIREDVAEALDGLVIDSRTGKRVPGTKGLISKIANNALTRELVALGLLGTEALEELEDY